MGLYKKFINQTRKPEGTLGKMMVNGMNSGHAKMADWGMSHLPALIPSQIAELGCGGGRNAGELSKRYPLSKVVAVDYSEVSVAKAKEYNRETMFQTLSCPMILSIWQPHLRPSISGPASKSVSPRSIGY